jgi:hypothetical protein
MQVEANPHRPPNALLLAKGAKWDKHLFLWWIAYYPSSLANLTVIILFSEMLKFSKNISSKSKKL